MNDHGNLAEAVRSFRSHYRSGRDHLGRDFFEPALRHCTNYSRASAYFTTQALAAWVGALPRLLGSPDVMVRLLISPNLSVDDLEALRRATDEVGRSRLRQELADSILKRVLNALDPMEAADARREAFAWLVAHERLEVRFAFPAKPTVPGIFHEKIGVFEFDGGHRVAFIGSANETGGGHYGNYESIDVYRSWVPGDEERVQLKEEQFEEAWEGTAPALDVQSPSPRVLEEIKTYAADDFPEGWRETALRLVKEDEKWRHQGEALKEFLEARRGVLEMATGTGKTRTALKIITELYESGSIDSVIVSTEGNDLLRQWVAELQNWIPPDWPISVYRHFAGDHEIGRYAAHSDNSILVVSRQQLKKLFTLLGADGQANTLMIHDEVHGFGSEGMRRELVGTQAAFPFVLGLSATPEREYDEAGNDFIEQEIGPVIYEFALEDAIKRGILCEFDYEPLPYELTEEDRERLAAVYAARSKRNKEGNPMPKEEVWRRLADVYKTAEQKIPVFADYLRNNSEVLEDCIIFVHTTDYGNRLLDLIHSYTSRYSTYYSDDSKDQLALFSGGGLDCLVTCYRLSQGIDVQRLKNVVLFSSDRAKLQTIQRMGRCLRFDPDNPDKKARVVDFVRQSGNGGDDRLNADEERQEWLEALAKVKRQEGQDG